VAIDFGVRKTGAFFYLHIFSLSIMLSKERCSLAFAAIILFKV
jgi:hypothetical protein